MSDEVWELESGGGDRLFAREWPWRISCQIRPASIEVRAAPTDTGATELRLDASVPGFGPVPARHLANHLRGLELRIRRQAAAESIRRIERQTGGWRATRRGSTARARSLLDQGRNNTIPRVLLRVPKDAKDKATVG